MRIPYIRKRFSTESMFTISKANDICEEYARQGYDLTLRQLYYQFVSRDLIPNNMRSYKRLGSIVNDARLAGLLDWDFIVDRTRNISIPPSWGTPADIVRSAASSFRVDRWKDQPYRVEVWVEKDALGGVIERASQRYRVPWFSCRGYTSQSEIWGAAQRLKGYIEKGQIPIILHLGDHDPSGIDMTRDIRERLELFLYQDWTHEMPPRESGVFRRQDIRTHMAMTTERVLPGTGSSTVHLPVLVLRIALNGDQIEEYNPPPNPTKLTDSRARSYLAEFGEESWELDALSPDVLDNLINDTIVDYLDQSRYDARVELENEWRAQLRQVAEDFENSEEEE